MKNLLFSALFCLVSVVCVAQNEFDINNNPEARRMYEEAMKTANQSFDPANQTSQTNQAQNEFDINNNAEARRMYEETMKMVNQTYNQTYETQMAAAEKIMADAEIYRQQLEAELNANIETWYQEAYAEAQAMFEKIMVDAETYRIAMEASLKRSAEEVYNQTLARGGNEATAMQAAQQQISAFTSNANAMRNFSSNLNQSIMTNWPTGNPNTYYARVNNGRILY